MASLARHCISGERGIDLYNMDLDRGFNMNQKDIFKQVEGDNWFKRNREKMEQERSDLFYLEPVLKYLKDGMKILEIGCSTGVNLNYLRQQSQKKLNLYGIDPSRMAIQKGQELFLDFKLEVSTAEEFKMSLDSYDMVVLGFCLYVIDRKSLSEIVSKVERSLKPKGFVVIVDFDVKHPTENKNKHFEGLMSYKMDYGLLFSAQPSLTLIEKYPWSHLGSQFHEDVNERCATTILYKDT